MTRARRRFPAPGFTLIELLICVSVVAIISIPTAQLITEMNRVSEEVSLRMETFDAADRFAAAWVADVTRAAGTTLERPGVLKLDMTGENGAVQPVRYVYNGVTLTREAGPGEATPLVLESVARAAFSPEGTGWRLAFTLKRTTGRRDFTWDFGRVATPLTAGMGGGS